MYNLEDSQLRVCGHYIRDSKNKEAFEKCRFIILQHLLDDTEELVSLIHDAAGDIFAVIAKPYSIDNAVFSRMAKKYTVMQESYEHMDGPECLDQLLQDAIAKCKEDQRKIVIIEVGGYFAAPLSRLKEADLQYIAGVIEDTSFGHYRYEKLIDEIRIPVFSVARSALKEIEAKFVGDAAVQAINRIFSDTGVSISGRNALVIGYGMIGENVALALRAHNVTVSIYDRNDHRNLSAFSKGFHIHKKLELLKDADIIFSATGEAAITLNDIEGCKNDVVLASVGSKDTEFDIRGLKDLAIRQTQIGPHMVKYKLPSSRNVVVVRDGTAVNFIVKSIPTEIIDLVFAEIIQCCILLLKEPDRYASGTIHYTSAASLNDISKEWLKFINH